MLHSSKIASFIAFSLMFLGTVLFAERYQQAVGPPPAESLTPPVLLPGEFDGDPVLIQAAEEQQEGIEIVLVDESVSQVLEMLADLTERKVIAGSNLPQAFINFNSRGTLSLPDATVALESLLNLNGVAVSEMGDEFLKAVPLQSVKFKSPELIHHSTTLLPPSEKVYSRLFQIRYMKWEELVSLVNNSVTQGSGSVEFIQSSQSVLMTDSLSNLQRMESLIRKLDVPSEKTIITRRLQHVEATQFKQIMDQTLEGPFSGLIDGEVSITVDERGNQVMIVTDSENGQLIEKMIGTFDVDVEPFTKSRVIPIKHAEALEVVKLLESLVGSQTDAEGRELPSGRNNPVNQGDNERMVGQDGSAEDLQFSTYASFVADERSNSIIVYGTESDLVFVQQIIDDIDVTLSQVKIDVVIVEVTLTDETSRGIESFGVSYDENDEIIFGVNEGSALPWSVNGSISDFLLNSWTIPNFTLSTVLDVARQDSDVSVLSAPTLITTHNREAVINAGESRPVITATDRDSTGLNSRSQVQFKDIGIQLKVKPLIGKNGVVQLEIEQTVESVVDEVLIDGNSQPVIGKREATSYLTVGDGDLVVLGGLQEKTIREVGGRMAFLGSIPLFGKWLFSSERDRETNRELIIFLKPTVFHDLEDYSRETFEYYDRYQESENMRRVLEETDVGEVFGVATDEPVSTPLDEESEPNARTLENRGFRK